MEIQLLNIEEINRVLEELEEHKGFLSHKIQEDLNRYNKLSHSIRKDSEEISHLYQLSTRLSSKNQEGNIDKIEDLLLVAEESHIQSLVLLRSVAEHLENLSLLITSDSYSSS